MQNSRERSMLDVYYEIFNKVNSLAIYTTDQDLYNKRDKMVTHTNAVRAGKTFRGDCEDIAGTILEVAILDYNFLMDKMRLARVGTEYCKEEHAYDHMVAIIDGVVFDNRYKKPLPIESFTHYKWDAYAYIPLSKFKDENGNTQWFKYKQA